LKVPAKWNSKPEDLDAPWEAEVNGERWIVHLNEFPDEYMYRPTIDGTVLGDFRDSHHPSQSEGASYFNNEASKRKATSGVPFGFA
jgi:hypothetical protein